MRPASGNPTSIPPRPRAGRGRSSPLTPPRHSSGRRGRRRIHRDDRERCADRHRRCRGERNRRARGRGESRRRRRENRSTRRPRSQPRDSGPVHLASCSCRSCGRRHMLIATPSMSRPKMSSSKPRRDERCALRAERRAENSRAAKGRDRCPMNETDARFLDRAEHTDRADDRERHRDRFLRCLSRRIDQHRHGNDRAAAAEEGERQADRPAKMSARVIARLTNGQFLKNEKCGGENNGKAERERQTRDFDRIRQA